MLANTGMRIVTKMRTEIGKMKPLLEEIHDIIEEGDNGTSHDIVDIMFNLLDVNQLAQLQDIIINENY